MPAKMIQSDDEMERWLRDGKPYSWIIDMYLRKYSLVINPSMISNFRRRKGIPPRQAINPSLIPWKVDQVHQGSHLLGMLRMLARDMEGFELTERERKRVDSFKQSLIEQDAVVFYDPESVDGFYRVHRQPGDEEWIRPPAKRSEMRQAAKEQD